MNHSGRQVAVSIERPPRDARPLWDHRDSTRPGPSVRTAQRLCDVVALATAAAFAIPVGELISSTTRRTASIAFARQSAMYLAHVTFGLTYSQVARAFGRDRTTAAHACQLIEERRDDPAVEAVLGSLEHACGKLRRRLSAPTSAPVQP
jgi:hypothetical protein